MPHTPGKILIRTPNWLGDLMMSTAFINVVLESFPGAIVDLIVKSGFESLPLPHRGEILPYDKKTVSPIQFGKSLRKRDYNTIFILPPSFSSALMAYVAKIPNRIGYVEQFRGFLLKPAIKYQGKPRSRHLIDEYIGLMPRLKIKHPRFPTLFIEDDWAQSHLPERDAIPDVFISIAPGAIFGPAKQWPVNHYRRLASLAAKRGIASVIVGTDKDHAIGEQISDCTDNVLNLCGQTSLNQLVALLAKSRLLVSNDSGAMHIMAALQKPQIAVFGSTSAVWTSPRNPHSEIIQLEMECSPCFQRTCRFGHYHCLEHIQPERVMEIVEKLIQTET